MYLNYLNSHLKFTQLICFSICSALALSSCGGGGGGDGESRTTSGSGGRSAETALRVLHGSIDTPPVIVSIDRSEFQTVDYNSETDYRGVSPGAHTISVAYKNEPDRVVSQFSTTFSEDTEYSLFLTGQARNGGLRTNIFEEVPALPDVGTARAQIYNSFDSSSGLSLDFAGSRSEGVGSGQKSEFFNIPVGPGQLLVRSGGTVVKSISYDVPDQGEVTVMVSGSNDLGIVFAQVYRDFD